MNAAKITISLNQDLLDRIDQLVQASVFASRSQAIQTAVAEKVARIQRTRLAQECAKLDPEIERREAERGLAEDMKSWPPY